ncbi:MAG: hypothetical protein AB7T63_06105 [Planctomycetota bacterium]
MDEVGWYGTVVGPAGEPVSGATVHILPVGMELPDAERVEFTSSPEGEIVLLRSSGLATLLGRARRSLHATTARDGTWRVPTADSRLASSGLREHVVFATHGGQATTPWRGALNGVPELGVGLRLGGHIQPRLRAVTRTGRGLPGVHATVVASRDRLDLPSYAREVQVLDALSNARGEIAFPPLAAHADWHLQALVRTKGRTRWRDRHVPMERLLRRTPACVVLAPSVTVTGRVELPRGVSAHALEVYALEPDLHPLAAVETHAEIADTGEFRLERVPVPRAVLVVRARGRSPFQAEDRSVAGLVRSLDTHEGRTLCLGTLQVPRVTTLSGVVRTPRDAPKGGHIRTRHWFAVAPIEGDGAFHLEDVPEGHHDLIAFLGPSDLLAGSGIWHVERHVLAGRNDVVIDVRGGGYLVLRPHDIRFADRALVLRHWALAHGGYVLARGRDDAEPCWQGRAGPCSGLVLHAAGYRPTRLPDLDLDAERVLRLDVTLEPWDVG